MMTTAELTPSETPTIPRSGLRVQGCFRSQVHGPGLKVLGFLVQGLGGGGGHGGCEVIFGAGNGLVSPHR